MADTIPQSPNSAYLPPPPSRPPTLPPSPPPLPPSHSPPHDPLESTSPSGRFFPLRRPPLRFTTEFDSEGPLFLHKLSCKFFDGLAKLKFSFQNDTKGGIFYPQLGFVTNNLSILYNVESRNALLKGSLDLGKSLQVRTTYDIQEQLGKVAMVASMPDPSVKLELSSSVPFIGLPRATLQFPFGELALEHRENVKENDEVTKVVSVDGIVKSQILNGLCTVMYNGNDLNLRYLYKDKDLTFIPSFYLPSNALSFAFKRRFSPSDKLSNLHLLNNASFGLEPLEVSSRLLWQCLSSLVGWNFFSECYVNICAPICDWHGSPGILKSS